MAMLGIPPEHAYGMNSPVVGTPEMKSVVTAIA